MKNVCLLPFQLISLVFASESNLRKLETYLESDFNGGRLNSDTSSELLKLVAWEEEPGWDIVTAIKDYEVKALSDFEFEVIFEVTGICPESTVSGLQFEKVNFKIDSNSGVILEPRINPHVSNELLCEEYSCCTWD